MNEREREREIMTGDLLRHIISYHSSCVLSHINLSLSLFISLSVCLCGEEERNARRLTRGETDGRDNQRVGTPLEGDASTASTQRSTLAINTMSLFLFSSQSLSLSELIAIAIVNQAESSSAQSKRGDAERRDGAKAFKETREREREREREHDGHRK